ncbi:MAG: hypothetical protein AAF829_07105 [Pseudomonadota bacterium]
MQPSLLAGFVLLSGLFQLVFVASPHTLEWTSNQDIPFVLRATDPGFNPGDFFTNASEGAPRTGFAAFVRMLMALGMDWEAAFYTLKAAVILIRPILVFFILLRLAEHVLASEKTPRLLRPAGAIAAIYAATMYQTDTWYMIAGWDQIHTNDVISPMSLSATLLFGSLLVILTRHGRAALLFAGALLAVAGWVHPVVALCGWVWISILLVGLNWSFGKTVRLAGILLPFALVPALLLQVLYVEPNVISAQEYRDIYVTWRHPMHFDMGYAVGHVRGLPILVLLFAVGTAWTVLSGNRRQGAMIALMALFPVAALLTQFITTNLTAISIFVSLGPSRALNLLVPFLVFGLSLAGFTWAARRSPSADSVVLFPDKMCNAGPAILSACLLSVIVGPVHVQRGVPDQGTAELVDWIAENTSEDDVIADMNLVRDRPFQAGYFEPNLVSSAIRIHAQRAVFYDKTFPYRRAAASEFKARNDFNRSLVGLSMEMIACSIGQYSIDYAYYHTNHPHIPADQSVFSNEDYLVFRVPAAVACDTAH